MFERIADAPERAAFSPPLSLSERSSPYRVRFAAPTPRALDCSGPFWEPIQIGEKAGSETACRRPRPSVGR